MSCHGDQITNPKIWLDRHFCLVRRIVRIGLDAKTTKKKIKKRKHLRSHEKCLCGQEGMINSIRIAMATSWDGRGTFKGVWLTWGIHMYSAPPWVLIWITSKLYMKPWPSTHTFIRNLANYNDRWRHLFLSITWNSGGFRVLYFCFNFDYIFFFTCGGTKRHFSLFRWNMFKMQRTARVLRDSIVDYLHFLLILPNKERQLGNTNNIKVA